MNDTIFAPATPIGGAIAIIRISGSDAKAALARVFSGRIAARYMSHGMALDAGEPVDDAMAVYFAAPHSYTGEDMAELYLHGGYAVVSRMLASLEKCGLRPAQPGEFTQRAFLNGKLDLARAEAVMDIINASSERGAHSALEQLTGRLSERINAAQSSLLDLLAGVDAAIDYPEELEEDVFLALPDGIASVKNELDGLVRGGVSARMVREGARIAIIGRPNAGKSSLFNAMLGQDRAIVTAREGTTRDILEAELIINGISARLFDTAGLRAASDEAESIGVARAREIIDRADLMLIAIDAAAGIGQEERALLNRPARRLAVVCKTDLSDGNETVRLAQSFGVEAVAVSAATGEGMPLLMKRIAQLLAPECESALVTNARHIAALRQASAALDAALGAAEPDCIATDLRAALIALGEITGASVDADVVARIFERFCVGK